MCLKPLDCIGIKWLSRTGHAKGTIVHMPSGPPCNLAKFSRRQATVLLAVELACRREGDVIDIEVQTHANGISRHEITNVSRLIKSNLCVTRSWRQSAQDDGRASMLAPDELGDGVNVRRRKSDDR